MATTGEGKAALKWNKAAGAVRCDVFRTDTFGNIEIANAAKVTRWEDHVCAYGAAGQAGATSNTITVLRPLPNYSAQA